MRNIQAEARLAIKHLSQKLPCSHPVRLGKPLDKSSESSSTANFTGKTYVVRVRSTLTALEAQDCIIHEWAHFRTWGVLQAQTYEHDAHWGIEYAKVYTEFMVAGERV